MLRWLNYPIGAVVGLALMTLGLIATGNLERLDGKGGLYPLFGGIFLLIAGAPMAVSLALFFQRYQPPRQSVRIFISAFLTGSIGVAVASFTSLIALPWLWGESIGALVIVASVLLFVFGAIINLVACWN